MKVGTDGVLVGAWTNIENIQSILDIGCGTGLISLMIAQRCDALITGVDIDINACDECTDNFLQSPWSSRLSTMHCDFNQLINDDNVYDLIVSNPPFFTNGVLAPDKSRATARHCESLNYASLINFAAKKLSSIGHLSFISPSEYADDIIALATYNRLYLNRRTNVFSKPSKANPIRTLWELSRLEKNCSLSRLYLRNDDNSYTDEYIKLTQDFYINF